jgi:hypothetical protein
MILSESVGKKKPPSSSRLEWRFIEGLDLCFKFATGNADGILERKMLLLGQ